MSIFKIIRPEIAKALSNRVVICLAICLAIACISLIWAVFSALFDTGRAMLAPLIIIPLAKGLSYYVEILVRYCRPDWFKPTSIDQPE